MAKLEPVSFAYAGATLECPMCHQPLSVEIQGQLEDFSARPIGGDHFHTNVSLSAKMTPLSVHIVHDCIIPPEEN